MFPYGAVQSGSRPGPEIDVELKNPLNNSAKITIPSLIDSGAVMSAIPNSLINALDEKTLSYQYRTVNGATGKQKLKSYFVNLKIANCEFKNIEVVALNSNFALIGRDILNLHRITMDGPNKIWEVDLKC